MWNTLFHLLLLLIIVLAMLDHQGEISKVVLYATELLGLISLIVINIKEEKERMK